MDICKTTSVSDKFNYISFFPPILCSYTWNSASSTNIWGWEYIIFMSKLLFSTLCLFFHSYAIDFSFVSWYVESEIISDLYCRKVTCLFLCYPNGGVRGVNFRSIVKPSRIVILDIWSLFPLHNSTRLFLRACLIQWAPFWRSHTEKDAFCTTRYRAKIGIFPWFLHTNPAPHHSP